MKTCSTCSSVKVLADFHKNKNTKDGLKPSCKGCCKLYYLKNNSALKELSKNYYANNKEAVLKRQKKYNKTYLPNYQRERVAKDPLFKLKRNIRSLIKHSFSRKGFSKKSKTAQILGCSFEELRVHLIGTFEVNYNTPFEQTDVSLLHIDHVIPLASAKTEQELLKLNHYSNLQYLFAKDNLEKSDKLDWKLYKECF